MKNKKLLIIIPGSRAKKPFIFKKVFDRLYKHFGLENRHDGWAIELKKHIESKSDMEVRTFGWSRGITKIFSLNPAIKKLTKLLRNTQVEYNEIILFGKSFGGLIAQEAIKKFGCQKFHLIYIATPHKNKEIQLPQVLSVTNIYSKNDDFQKLANRLFYFGFGFKKIKNVQNISLPNIKHSDFNNNIEIFYKGKQTALFDFYTDIILTR